jgi:hypothetical protein
MKHYLSAFQAAGSNQDRAVKLGLFALWLILVLYMVWHHNFWRDEVRALSIAISGDNVVEMLKTLHGDGHPAFWYLLLRAPYEIVGNKIVLPIVATGIAVAAALLLVLRSPFSWWLIALLLVSNFMMFEYSVMARNYGISVLLLFLLAICYPRYRDRSVFLGVLLFLLANTNAHSVLLVGAFLLMWLIDILTEHGLHWTRALRTFLFNAVISAIGIVVCFATIYPTYNDIAVPVLPGGIALLGLLIRAVLLPATSFDYVSHMGTATRYLGPALSGLLMSLVMFGSLLGLIRFPGAFIAALAALISSSVFFAVVYPGLYRHQALWLVFLVSMYWISYAKNMQPERRVPSRFIIRSPSMLGSALMVVLIALQVPISGIKAISGAAFGGPPLSRARDFSAFVASRDDLRDAIIIAHPDTLLEAVPYYIHNRTYLTSEQRFGNVVKFTRNARLALDLEDILTTAKALQAETGKPILILLHEKLDPLQPQTYLSGYGYWTLSTTPDQVRRFLSSTRYLTQFAPALTDESYDAYLLNRS